MSRNQREALQKAANQNKAAAAVNLTSIEKIVLGVRNPAESGEQPYVNLKYYHSEFECFSVWNTVELRAFSDFVRKLRSVTWTQIFMSGGKAGEKTGFGYTIHKDKSKLPRNPNFDSISPDITFFELRVTKVARVHGFRAKDSFFLVWLDSKHQIYPG